MSLINDVNREGSDIESYIISLIKLLSDKVEKINSIISNLEKFQILSKDEEALSTKFTSNYNDILDLHDINSKNFDFIEDEFEQDFRDEICLN